MKQIVQNLGNGNTTLQETPAPLCRPNHLVVSSRASLISIGTERMLVDFGQANLLQKARKQPDKVKLVVDKALTDGVATTLEAVRSKLNQPIPMGYCVAGVVTHSLSTQFAIGDRVVTNGAHAEVVSVGHNLAAHIPPSVTFEEAAFTPVAAIGLQGIRLARPDMGETVVVLGLGLIGLLTVQMLLAQGCKVIGLDLNDARLALAASYGAETVRIENGEDPVASTLLHNQGQEVDAVLVTASTASSAPMSQAARMCRKRGRIILVGVIGLELNRHEFYEKELTFQVSCSYGPGRYDSEYEVAGTDYPRSFVRWTEQRNFDTVLSLLAGGALKVDGLVTRRHEFIDAADVYASLANDSNSLGIVLNYPETSSADKLATAVSLNSTPVAKSTPGVVAGIIGAGNYASRVLIPAMNPLAIRLKTIVSAGGLTAAHHGTINGFETASSNIDDVIDDPEINLVVIATRHDTHASLVQRALASGKHVFVEKPLALTHTELHDIRAAQDNNPSATNAQLMLGFNRRFAPHVVTMKRLLSTMQEPKTFNFSMNAGIVPADSWVHAPQTGGGRIVGEACHLIDLMRFLTGHRITSVHALGLGAKDSSGVADDKTVISLGFADGSIGSIQYFANGNKRIPKERHEVFVGGRTLQLNNYRFLQGHGWPDFKRQRRWKQDKGQAACIQAFAHSLANGQPAPISLEDIFEVSAAAIDAGDQARRC